MRNAFHQAAVAEEHVREVIDDRMTRAIELRREGFLGQGHADRRGQPLAQRTGRGLDAEPRIVLGMPRRVRAELTELLQILDADRIAAEVQHGVQQHRRVAVREHETITIEPQRIGWVVLQLLAPEHLGDVRHAHGRSGMP